MTRPIDKTVGLFSASRRLCVHKEAHADTRGAFHNGCKVPDGFRAWDRSPLVSYVCTCQSVQRQEVHIVHDNEITFMLLTWS